MLGAGLAWLPAGQARAVKLPAPGPRDTCPVCGMFVAPYPYWIATVVWRDGPAVHFDGAKDFFKYLLDLKKYEPRRSRADILAMGVTDYYGAERIVAQTATYVIGSDVLGPMGHELVPHGSAEEAVSYTHLDVYKRQHVQIGDQEVALILILQRQAMTVRTDIMPQM